MHPLILIISICIGSFVSQAAYATADPRPDTVVPADLPGIAVAHQPLYLAESEKQGENSEEPRPGSLVIPGEEKDKSEKKCLNVCREWGEECIINPRTGARNCRRTCKDFGMECF